MTMIEIGYRLMVPLAKSGRNSALVYLCDISDCPLLQQGRCINVGMFDRCVYGRVREVQGWTKRAQKYNQFAKKWREKAKEKPIKSVARTIAYIGDWVWLPYPFMNHADGAKLGIPFEGYSSAFSSGRPFIKRHNFTTKAIQSIAKLRPRAMMGGVIRDYEKSSLPRFLADLKAFDRQLFDAAAKLEPSIIDIADGAEVQPIPLKRLRGIGWHGRATMYGRDAYIYSSGNAEIDVPKLSEFDNPGPFKVTFRPVDDALVVLGREDYIRVKNRIRQ